MTQRSALCGFLASVLLLVPLTLSAAENDAPIADGPHAGAVDLLRGATLDDFDYFLLDGEQREKAFSLEDGVLSIAGTPFGWLGTKNDYHNFVVETEFRLLDPEGETNSGFLVRMGEQKPTTFLPHCVEIGIYEKETGTLFGFHDFRIMGEESRMVYYKDGQRRLATVHGVAQSQTRPKQLSTHAHKQLRMSDVAIGGGVVVAKGT